MAAIGVGYGPPAVGSGVVAGEFEGAGVSGRGVAGVGCTASSLDCISSTVGITAG